MKQASIGGISMAERKIYPKVFYFKYRAKKTFMNRRHLENTNELEGSVSEDESTQWLEPLTFRSTNQ